MGHKFPNEREELKKLRGLRGLRVSEPWASTYFTMNSMYDRTVESFRGQVEFISLNPAV